MRDATNASAGVYQRRSSMLRAASSRPAHSVARGRHDTEQGVCVSMANRSRNVWRAVVVVYASITGRSVGVGYAAVRHSANIISAERSVRPASADQYANMDECGIVAIHAHR
jgi:hypothetical protein